MPLTAKDTQDIIAKERATPGGLPNLKGVKVWIAGATASGGNGLSADRILQIQNFWLAYFQACGANLTKERYAPTLLDFNLAGTS